MTVKTLSESVFFPCLLKPCFALFSLAVMETLPSPGCLLPPHSSRFSFLCVVFLFPPRASRSSSLVLCCFLMASILFGDLPSWYGIICTLYIFDFQTSLFGICLRSAWHVKLYWVHPLDSASYLWLHKRIIRWYLTTGQYLVSVPELYPFLGVGSGHLCFLKPVSEDGVWVILFFSYD